MRILLALLLAAPAISQAPVFELGTLLAPTPQGNDVLGSVLALDDEWAVAGVPNRTLVQSTEGIVLLWPRIGLGYGAGIVLQSPLPTNGGQFGYSLELSGGELVVGELYSDLFGSPTRGAVHRYRDVNGTWAYVDSIPNPVQFTFDYFGWSVARDGDLIAIGAPIHTQLFSAQGAVYLFRLVGGQWVQETMLVASDGDNGDWFGSTVAISGGRVLVGAPQKITGGLSSGAAYAFEQVAGVWTETGRFAVDLGSGDQLLGVALDVDGTTAVIGAAQVNDVGAAYVFVDTGATWVRQERLQPAGLGSVAIFGQSLDLAGDRLIVGAWQDEVGGMYSGSAWVFVRTAGTFAPRLRLLNSDQSVAAHGFGVAQDGNGSYLVGQPYHSTPTTGSIGAVRHYRPQPALGASYCTPVANSTTRTGSIAALGSDLVVDDQVSLVAYDLPLQSFGFFLTSRTQGAIQQPGGSQGVLCLSGSIGRYVGPGQIRHTGTVGFFALQLALGAMPTPTGLVSVLAGQTWNFTAWHRDSSSGGATSNFTNAASVLFL